MALSGLDIYKLLPKTNCRECGLATCLAFAMQIAKKAVPIDKCPYVSADSKQILEASSLPPIKLITIGETDRKLTIGNETVMFRHEEKFHHPCGIGFIIEDSESDAQIKEKLQRIAGLQFERIGQTLQPDLVAITHCKEKARFLEVVRMVNQCCALPLVLITSQTDALQEALTLIKGKRPLVYSAGTNNLKEFAQLAKEYSATLVITASDLEGLSTLTKEAASLGITDLMLDTGKKPLAQKIWDFTQIRKQAIKKSNRSLGYPTIAIIERDDPLEEAYEAATFITKYAGIVLLKSIDTAQVLPLLTLRQNIYTDPQKPLQIEPKLYPIGQVTDSSPVLVTTNFSLSYYTVLGEVEASKVPSYILSVDTEGMSVLTAWAAEKFTPDKLTESIEKYGVKERVNHSRMIIPGYVAVISGELEEKSGWQIIVGPKEASGIPSFLKNL